MAAFPTSRAAGPAAHTVTSKDFEAVVHALTGHAPTVDDLAAVQELLEAPVSRRHSSTG
ncbi:hypothetical protein [Rhodococcus sp. NPDC047139]|uniref:hypothetical protein n=1 Tax=Rhodococcus sp. NPDC047139 TaxID=3155141 RepID=UPI0033EC933C